MEVLFDKQPELLAEHIVVRAHSDAMVAIVVAGVIGDRQRRGVDAIREKRQKLTVLARRG
jgi:hypothetical protein